MMPWLLAMATERISNFDTSTLISQEAVDHEFGFSAEDIANADEVEFE